MFPQQLFDTQDTGFAEAGIQDNTPLYVFLWPQ